MYYLTGNSQSLKQGEHESNDHSGTGKFEKHIRNGECGEQDQQQEKGNSLYPSCRLFLLADVGFCPPFR
jgi:hypothetical protein